MNSGTGGDGGPGRRADARGGHIRSRSETTRGAGAGAGVAGRSGAPGGGRAGAGAGAGGTAGGVGHTWSAGGGAGRDPRRRRALLEAADRVILREGPEASMASIAAEAGISKPILYRHFGDKSGLYQALAERHVRVLVESVRAAFSRPGHIRGRARAAIGTYLAAIAANRQLYRFLIHRAGAEDTATHSAMSALIRGLGGEIAGIILAEGLLDDLVRVHIWSHATVGMVQAAGDWWLDHPDVSRATVVDSLVDLILDGLSEITRR